MRAARTSERGERGERGERLKRPAASEQSDAARAAWARYRSNVPRHLVGISRDLQAHVMTTLAEECGHVDLRPSFGPLLSLIWKQGRPLGEIAAELAISNQACSQLANLAEEAGYLERRPHPEDGRAKLAVLTARGAELVREGVRVILACESDYASHVGASAYRRFTASLAALYRGLGIPIHADAGLTARAGRSVGVLPLIAVRIQGELMSAANAAGHDGLKASHAQVLPLVGPNGARIHEIAQVQGLSRQAISATARDLVSLGYLRRAPDPDDRRGILLRLTPRGVALVADTAHAVDAIEEHFREILGPARFEVLQRVALDLYQSLHIEEHLLEASLRNDASAGNGRRGAREIEQLAAALRRQLGSEDAARLAALLEPQDAARH